MHNSRKAESPPSTEVKKSTLKTMVLDVSQKDKMSSAEAMWIFKVAEQDYSLKSRDGVAKLFETVFSDSDIAYSRIYHVKIKVSYVVSNGLGPFLGKRLCNDIASSVGTFKVSNVW